MLHAQGGLRDLSAHVPDIADKVLADLGAECTGTPPGVGLRMKPPQYLKPGDVVELGIEGLGRPRPVCLADA